MDPMELRSGKTLVETEVRGDSEDDFEEEVQSFVGFLLRWMAMPQGGLMKREEYLRFDLKY